MEKRHDTLNPEKVQIEEKSNGQRIELVDHKLRKHGWFYAPEGTE